MNVPNSDMTPHAAHITKLRPIDPVLISSPVGETNIPEPVKNDNIAFDNRYIAGFSSNTVIRFQIVFIIIKLICKCICIMDLWKKPFGNFKLFQVYFVSSKYPIPSYIVA